MVEANTERDMGFHSCGAKQSLSFPNFIRSPKSYCSRQLYKQLSKNCYLFDSIAPTPWDRYKKNLVRLRKRPLNLKYIQDNHLFRQNSKNVPICRAVDHPVERQNFLQQLFNESGHKGRKGTYPRVVDQYWWDNLHTKINSYVHLGKEFQHREFLLIWRSIISHLDNCFVAKSGCWYSVHALLWRLLIPCCLRCDLPGWVEAKPLRNPFFLSTCGYFLEGYYLSSRLFRKIDHWWSKDKDAVAELAEKYRVKWVIVSTYHPQANEMIKRSHKPVVNALSKMTAGGIY